MTWPKTTMPTVVHCVQERYERLAREEAARQAARRAAKEAEIYGGMDFKPQLNPRSLALAPAGSGGVEALASADKRQRKLEELQRAEEERRRAECTFQVGGQGQTCVGCWAENRSRAGCRSARGNGACVLVGCREGVAGASVGWHLPCVPWSTQCAGQPFSRLILAASALHPPGCSPTPASHA